MTDVHTEPTPTLQGSTAQKRGSFIWYELMTTDPDGAKEFYDAVIGWNIGPVVSDFNGYRMIGRSDGKLAGGVLPISSDMREHGARPTWLGYIQVPNVDDALKSLGKGGGKILMPPADIYGAGRIAMVSDPSGAPFYVMTPAPPSDQPDAVSDVFSPNAEQRVSWNELQTHDVEGARAFYGEHFGWATDDFMDMGQMGKYRFIDHDGQRLGALFTGAEGEPCRFRFYIRVPSITAAKRIAEQRGGTIDMGPHEVPTGDWIVVGTDPQGAEFALVGGA